MYDTNLAESDIAKHRMVDFFAEKQMKNKKAVLRGLQLQGHYVT